MARRDILRGPCDSRIRWRSSNILMHQSSLLVAPPCCTHLSFICSYRPYRLSPSHEQRSRGRRSVYYYLATHHRLAALATAAGPGARDYSRSAIWTSCVVASACNFAPELPPLSTRSQMIPL